MGECYIARRTIENPTSDSSMTQYIQDSLIFSCSLVNQISDNNTAIINLSDFDIDTSELTVECCCMYTSIPIDNKGRFIDSRGANANTFAIGVTGTDGVVKIGGLWYEPPNKDTGITNIVPNQIFTISFVKTNDTVTFYNNGRKANQYDDSTIMNNHIVTLTLFQGADRNDRIINGQIYSLRIYNRALSDGEIIINYTSDAERYS